MEMHLYVLFVKTGYEQQTAYKISQVWKIDGLQPFIPMYDTYFKKNGMMKLEKKETFPGYVFIETIFEGKDFYLTIKPFILLSQNTFKLLRHGNECGSENCSGFEMMNDERKSFMRLYNNKYCIEMSQGFIENDLVVITKGPLKGFESQIKKIYRHKSEAVVEVRMMGRVCEMKVGLEIISKVPNRH
ncbi:MAG: antiterminator LoaP [Defluviitaleaceae bacterium]|nr:antiterminator LoaP [Defluviitaleaceae bacterium]